ncbi:ATP-binding cassette domain-containing protein [Microbacterium tumbae]
MSDPLLEVSQLTVDFRSRSRMSLRARTFQALKGVDLRIERGEVVAIVGESGSGKSTMAKCIVGLQRPTAGTIRYDSAELGPSRTRRERRAIQMVFQDPFSSLNPRLSIGGMLVEVLRVNGIRTDLMAARARAEELMELVGMPASALVRRPHAFSGGQRQRLGIARALALEPRLLIADEAVSALDVSVQASILMLLKRLQHDLGLSMLFISHDLAVVRQISDRIAVMSAGEIVERGHVADILDRPQHPFTRALVGSAAELPAIDPRVPEL